ncbi:MAG: SDR family oxidoreductase [Desulfobacterales bacterium]|nr:SDR family oxidoreductase [Desulfobacterales bacterium]
MAQTILVTGASSGIGKEAVRRFHLSGWHVLATMRNPEKEEELTKLKGVRVCRLDVEDSASIASAVSKGVAHFGAVDLLLNNAGYGSYGLLEASSMDEVRRQINVNLVGLIETTKTLLPHFRSRERGMIINVSSIGGQVAFPLSSLYNASKFAVEGLSESLRYELQAIGVVVKLIEPGMIKTDFAGRSLTFSNDSSLKAYQPLVSRYLERRKKSVQGAASAQMVAETIFQAATDKTDRFRYVAGEDAESLYQARKKLDDVSLFATIQEKMIG